MNGPSKVVHIFADEQIISTNSCIVCVRSVYDPDGPKYVFSNDIGSIDLGVCIQKLISSSYTIPLEDYATYFDPIPFMERVKQQDKWLKKVFKVTSMKRLYLKTIYCYFEVENEQIRILSYQRKNGYNVGDESPENWTKIPLDSTPEEIGRAVKLALTKCRGRGTEKIHERFKELRWE